jgi:hypothetical protein
MTRILEPGSLADETNGGGSSECTNGRSLAFGFTMTNLLKGAILPCIQQCLYHADTHNRPVPALAVMKQPVNMPLPAYTDWKKPVK